MQVTWEGEDDTIQLNQMSLECKSPTGNERYFVTAFTNYGSGHYTAVVLDDKREWWRVDNLSGSAKKMRGIAKVQPEVLVMIKTQK